MQIMAINLNSVNVTNVNDGIDASNVIKINLISYAISLRRYYNYIESCNCNTVVLAEQSPLYCKTTNNLSRYNDTYLTIQNMVLPPW
jgi:hypothetical protein